MMMICMLRLLWITQSMSVHKVKTAPASAATSQGTLRPTFRHVSVLQMLACARRHHALPCDARRRKQSRNQRHAQWTVSDRRMGMKLLRGEHVGCARVKMLHPVNSPPRLVFHVLKKTDQLVSGFRDTNNWRRCFSDGPHL